MNISKYFCYFLIPTCLFLSCFDRGIQQISSTNEVSIEGNKKVDIISTSEDNSSSQNEKLLLAKANEDGSKIYTRDGKYPTEVSDQLTCTVEQIEDASDINANEKIDSELAAILGDNFYSNGGTGKTVKAKYTYYHGGNLEIKAFAKLITSLENNSGILIKCSGTNELDLDACTKLIENSF